MAMAVLQQNKRMHAPALKAVPSQDLQDRILIQKDAIARDDLAMLVDFASHQEKKDVTVFDAAGSNAQGRLVYKVDKRIRHAQRVNITPILEDIKRINQSNIERFVNPYFAVSISGLEKPQLLVYGPGGHYKPHVDGEGRWVNAEGQEGWRKSLDRDLSVVYFLNDAFEGGELVFPALGLVIKPQAGTMVCFPSTHEYLHGVSPVTAGQRLSLVTWLRVEGYPTLQEVNRSHPLGRI